MEVHAGVKPTGTQGVPEDNVEALTQSTKKKNPKKKPVESDSEAETEEDDDGPGFWVEMEAPRKKKAQEEAIGKALRKVPTTPVAEKSSEPSSKAKKTVSFKKEAPVERGFSADKLWAKVLDTQITLSAREIVAASPLVRAAAIKQFAKVKIPVETKDRPVPPRLMFKAQRQAAAFFNSPENKETYTIDLSHLPREEIPEDSLEVLNAWLISDGGPGLPEGSLVMSDPYEHYLSTLEDGAEPKKVRVAAESTSLRAVHPLVNGRKNIECILDGGSQVVSMAADVAHELGIAYDPDIRISMQSANRQNNTTLGMAKNVPFRFDEITVYLQVHVIENPAYLILLGRPFDVLTRSVIKNTEDGGQLIEITDPNEFRRCTIPTVPRGEKRKILRRPDF